MAYIIRNNEVIAKVETDLKNGTEIQYSFKKCDESINQSREFNLVNARYAKISRAKKWDQLWNRSQQNFATEINEGEFYCS